MDTLFNCLCDRCIKELRFGSNPGGHYLPSAMSKLEGMLYKLLKLGKLTYLGHGRHREVFLSPSGKTVIKFPVSYDGIAANWSERQVYLGLEVIKYSKTISRKNLAGCRMLGPNLLIMTKVDTDISDDYLDRHGPDWIDYIDCIQVGFHPEDSRLVAFDYTSF